MNQTLRRAVITFALSVTVTVADPLPQQQISISSGSAGTWNTAWQGEMGRTYFIQWSLDLQAWHYAPIMAFGGGPKSFGGSSTSDKVFIRLKYTDRLTDNAELDDFDSDLVPNIGEVKYLGTDPFLSDSDSDGINDWNEDSDGDEIPDGWEALALSKLPTSYGFTSISDITQANIEQVANDAQLDLPPGVLPDQVSFEITVPSTDPLTVRPESEWVVAPTDLTFTKCYSAPLDLSSAFPDWHFDSGNALVLVKNSLTTITVAASTTSGNPAKLKVVRDPADISAVGTGPLTLLPVNATNSATISLDGRGSFYLVGWVDTDNDNIIDSGESRYVSPIILVDVNVVSVEYLKTPFSVHYFVPENGFDPAYSVFKFGKNEQDYINELSPGAPVPDPVPAEEMYGKAGIGIRANADLIGGKNGLRGTDRVMGGWSNNIDAYITQGVFRKVGVTGTKVMKTGLASNVNLATGYDGIAEVFQFNPVDPEPLTYEEPILDRFTLNAAIDGMNAICLTTTSFARTSTQPLGQRVKMVVWDTPTDSLPVEHPNYPGYDLREFTSGNVFSAFLSFWSSTEPFSNEIESSNVPARYKAGERTYQDSYKLEWSSGGFYYILPEHATVGADVFVDEDNIEEYSPVEEPNTVNHETRPPTSGSTIHFNAR